MIALSAPTTCAMEMHVQELLSANVIIVLNQQYLVMKENWWKKLNILIAAAKGIKDVNVFLQKILPNPFTPTVTLGSHLG